MYCDFYNTHAPGDSGYRYDQEADCTWHYQPCLCPENPQSLPDTNTEGTGQAGSPCVQASSTGGAGGGQRGEGLGPGSRGARHLLDSSSPGCYNCSQHEYFDHGTGTCVPCSKRRGPPGPPVPPASAGDAHPPMLPASFPAAPSTGLCPGVRSLPGTPATWARAAETGKATASALRPSR